MENLIQNKGLFHLSEGIFDHLNDQDLINFSSVSRQCREFVTFFGKKRLVEKFDLILARNDYSTPKNMKRGATRRIGQKCNLFERYPEWEKIYEVVKNTNFPAFTFFVTKVDEYGQISRKIIGNVQL